MTTSLVRVQPQYPRGILLPPPPLRRIACHRRASFKHVKFQSASRVLWGRTLTTSWIRPGHGHFGRPSRSLVKGTSLCFSGRWLHLSAEPVSKTLTGCTRQTRELWLKLIVSARFDMLWFAGDALGAKSGCLARVEFGPSRCDLWQCLCPGTTENDTNARHPDADARVVPLVSLCCLLSLCRHRVSH